MIDPFLDGIFKAIQQLGLSTVIIGVFILLLYRFTSKVVIPVSERLVQGHLNFLNDLKEILEAQEHNIKEAGCKSELLKAIMVQLDKNSLRLKNLEDKYIKDGK